MVINIQKIIKLLLIIIFIVSVKIGITQNYGWITPNQNYLKMYVINDGIFRINKVDFTNAGINVSTIDPRTVKVFYKGSQIPIYFYGEQDGVFNDTDYLDFYGTRNYGGLTNVYSETDSLGYVKDEYYDMYSDTNVYWIGWGGAYGLRYTDYNNPSPTPFPLDYYYAKFHFEQDVFYSLGATYDPDNDWRYFMNDRYLGEGWYWKLMAFMNTYSDTFSTPLKTISSQPCLMKIFAFPANASTLITNAHRIVLKINSTTFPDTLYSDNFNRIDTTVGFPSSYLNQSSINSFTIRYAPRTEFSGGQMNLDMLEILYPHRFEFDNNIVRFNSTISDSSSKLFKIKGFNSLNEIKIYDVKNGVKISTYQISADTLIFSANGNGQFEIINQSITQKPFRFKQKQVPDLVSTSNGADYLIVYNKLFTTQAEQLRNFRNSHDNFRSFKAEIEDVYDVFNYGIENPVAVRNFSKYVYNSWQSPKLKYLCLFGRGSIDPKQILPTSQFYQNLVPVYGNPPSDGYFGNITTGYFFYNQQISVGRLPAISVQEAQDMVNKIMAYDNQSIDTWVKEPIFIAGGESFSEQQTMVTQSEFFVNNYVIPPPYAGSPQRIYLNDSSGFVTYNYQDSIVHSINRGALFVNYMGHGGNGYWDYCFQDPNVLSNGPILPLIFSMTCFTGKNAQPDTRGYTEKFMIAANKGCIGYISSTGWSFSGSGNDYNNYLIQSISQDSLRRIGDILRKASNKLDSTNSFYNRNTVDCYNLIGDPASKLKFPAYPEFDIENSDYALNPAFPTIKKNINLQIYPKNLGTNADSCKINFQLRRNNVVYNSKDTIVYNWGYKKTLNSNFKLDSSGVYIMKITLDASNWYPQELKTNNIIFIPITLKNVAFIPLKPEDNQLISSDSVEFVGLNPQVNFNSNTVKLLLQFDTTSNFNSPLNQLLFKTNPNGVVTKFKIRIPILDTNIVYFWKLNAIINSDTLGWTEYRNFKYGSALKLNALSKSEKNNPDKILLLDSLITIYKNKPQQYSSGDFFQTLPLSTGIGLSNYTGNVLASSFGGDPWEPSYININNKGYEFITSVNWGGLYLFKMNKYTGALLDSRHIHFNTSTSSDSVTSFLNTFDTTQMLAGVKLVPNGVNVTLNSGARDKLKQFGSIYADSINIISWERWSIVSYKGLPNPIVSEGYNNTVWMAINSLLQPNFFYHSGYVNNFIGPAQYWKYFKWDQNLFSNSNLSFDIYGINTNNQTILLYSNLTNNSLVNIDTLNAFQYPNLKLVTNINNDTISGINSSILKSLTFKYQPPAELVIDSIAIIKPEPIINDGDEVRVSAHYYNVGYRNAYGVIGNWYVFDGAGNKVIMKSDTLNNVLKIDSMNTSSEKFAMHYFPMPNRKPNGLVTLYFEVKAFGQQNDYYDFNNTAFVNIPMKNSPLAQGNVDMYADGVKLEGGEYVKQKPEIMIKISNSQSYIFSAADTTNFRIYINNIYFSLKNINIDKHRTKSLDNRMDNSSITFYPELNSGENLIQIILKSIDGLTYDTVKYTVNVSNELIVKDLNNYPNPMKNSTNFLFTLGGANRTVECRIKIYTVSGRLVKLINSNANVGYNNIAWDGRDNEGDYMANGVYFYMLIIDGDVKKESSIQKLVILK